MKIGNGWRQALIVMLTAIVALMATAGPAMAAGEARQEASSQTYGWSDCTSPKGLHHIMSSFLQNEAARGFANSQKLLGREGGTVIVYVTFFVAECGKWIYAIYQGSNINSLRFVTNFFPDPRDKFDGLRRASDAIDYMWRKASAQCNKVTRYTGKIRSTGFTLVIVYRPNCQATTWIRRSDNPLRQVLCPNGVQL